MSTQLEQLLGYLDQDGVTEIVVSVGRPVAMRQHGAFSNLTSKPLSLAAIRSIVAGTAIALPEQDGSAPTTEVAIGARWVKLKMGRRGDDVVLRFEKGAPRAKAPSAGPRAKAPSVAPRTKGATSSPRTKGATSSPRTKGATSAPRSKTPSRAPKPSTPPKAPQSLARDGLDLGGFALDDGGLSLELDPGPALAPTPSATPTATVAPTAPSSSSTAVSALSTAVASPAPAALADLVAKARRAGASDLHVASGRTIVMRTAAGLVPVDKPGALDLATAEALLLPLLSPASRAQLDKVGYADLAVPAPGGGRLRANISRHQNGLKGTFRLALAKPASLEELGLPKDLSKVVSHHQGLIVIAGPSGHGKTTTLAALVDLINGSRAFHILTIEDPIEIEHSRKQAVISQREVGPHTKSFVTGLKASLREDPDVIVIGELRDRESVEIALTAAETGHLVISTMSTPSAAKTIDRLIDMFPSEEHTQVRASIAGALRAIVAQRLVPTANGQGVVPAIELVTGVLPLAVMIREDKMYQLPNLMQRGRAYGMIRMDESLLELARTGKITDDTAIAFAETRKDVTALLRPQAAAPAAAAPTAKSRMAGLFGKKEHE